MTDRARPVFLARRSYRRRRLIDAACLLPALGAGLFMVALLWGTGGTEVPALSSRAIYLFAIWGGLVVAAAALARPLARRVHTGGGEDETRSATSMKTDQ